MSFNDFVHEHDLKNETTWDIKIYQILNSIGLDNVDEYLRDGLFSSDKGIVCFYPTKRTHWVA